MNLKQAYEILKLPENAPIIDIKKAYKALSLQYHPDRVRNAADSTFNFLEIKKAYSFLQSIHDDAPISNSIKQPSPNEYQLELTFEEIFTGCIKQEETCRKIIDENGVEKIEKPILIVEIKPGLLADTRITLEKEGDRLYGKVPANVVFIVKEKPHPVFQRARFDLKYRASITTEEALMGCELQIPTLDAAPIELSIQESITRSTIQKIANMGMPYPNRTDKRGDLLVNFEIIEPQMKALTIELHLTLLEIMQGCTKIVPFEQNLSDPIDTTEKSQDKTIEVEVNPGVEDGFKIYFTGEKGEAGEQGSSRRSDLIVVIREVPNDMFKRRGSDLIYTAQITAKDQETGCLLIIPTLTSDQLKWHIDGPINHAGYRIVNRGLPCSDNPQKSGDLVVQFDIYEQVPTVEVELPLTLEEIFAGGLKSIDFKRKIIDEFGNEQISDEVLQVEIVPGIEDGTRITLRKQGHQIHGKIAADIVLTVRDLPHKSFIRNRADLEYTATISKSKQMEGGRIDIPTLDPNCLRFLNFDGAIKSHAVKRIPKLGLPWANIPEKRGDIVVKFKVMQAETKPKDADVVCELKLTLENIFKGCTKKLKIQRKIYNEENGEETFENKIVQLQIEPGTEEGTEFRLTEYGDQNKETLAADLVFITRDKQHLLFQRSGANLLYKAQITKSEAHSGTQFQIPTLEKEKCLQLKIKASTESNFIQTYPGEGLPKCGRSDERGNLIVRVEIVEDKQKDANVQFDMPTTLEELFHGCNKKLKISRTVEDANGTKREEKKTIDIMISPGMEDGAELIFHRFGDQRAGLIPGDVVFVIRDKPHKHFQRKGQDIEYRAKISRAEADSGSLSLEIPTLDGIVIQRNLSNPINDQTFVPIVGYGLPYTYDISKRADLIVRFDIQN